MIGCPFLILFQSLILNYFKPDNCFFVVKEIILTIQESNFYFFLPEIRKRNINKNTFFQSVINKNF
jgi:hypothetical protein